ncbi:SGMR2-like protein [Mya arenaria]|uniref:Sigma intracellular receptor 2 n=1 Tax=Mya arenaria TaxID=6604 RepID=A0ABY7DU78_MYAAR|nr:sigma intracellular receptor 2-like [Mya arenaria]WAR01265.1 SGMR2-like protein [Mya arenaria]
MERIIDILFLLYFGSHIPIALFFDFQAVLPGWMFPKLFVDTVDWYAEEFGDAMMKAKPAWFKSFCTCELFLQFPFFFVALYAYWKGISKCRWIRLPIIVYSTHVVTSLIPILFHIFLHDFTLESYKGPRTFTERLQLSGFYFPYFIVPLVLLLDALFHPVYVNGGSESTRTVKHKPKGRKHH